eukprot:7382824-Prymnesium_polylepis.1
MAATAVRLSRHPADAPSARQAAPESSVAASRAAASQRPQPGSVRVSAHGRRLQPGGDGSAVHHLLTLRVSIHTPRAAALPELEQVRTCTLRACGSPPTPPHPAHCTLTRTLASPSPRNPHRQYCGVFTARDGHRRCDTLSRDAHPRPPPPRSW